MKKIWLATALALAVPTALFADATLIAHKIADAYGDESFAELAALRYTTHVLQGTTTVSRKWFWNTESGKVICDTVVNAQPFHHEYNRNRMLDGNPGLNERVDRWFKDDQFWLLVPFQIASDPDLQRRDDGEQPLPIQPGRAYKLTVTYPTINGVPGDRYEIYYDAAYRIRQWILHRDAQAAPSLTSTWDEEVVAGSLMFATEHRGAVGEFRLWFTDISLRTKGDALWFPAKPNTISQEHR